MAGVFLYNCFLALYTTGVKLVSPWNPKANLWIKGRKNEFRHLEQLMAGQQKPLIWMHCASLGEFEQGRPLLEETRKQYSGYCILVTFFSPSGYEIRKNYKGADIICYLPMDSAANAKRFLDMVNPKLVLWIKYEYWFYYLKGIHKRQIPLLLVSGIFRDSQPFFKWYGGLHRQMLHYFTKFFVQNMFSKEKLLSLGLQDKTIISGDTRFDRVIDIAEQFEPIQAISDFCGNHPVIVAGSTWPEDEEELDHFANTHPELRFIIAPHEIGEDHLKDIEKLFHHSIRYSQLSSQQGDSAHVLIIDNIGMLSKLYQYATITYIGGGFGDSGLHNTLEAAVYGKPVIFGPEYGKFAEAVELVEHKGAFSVETALELEALLNKLLTNQQLHQSACQSARDYVYSKRGATKKVMDYIQENRLLTK